MPRKTKAPARKRRRSPAPYPSLLRKGFTPAENRARLLKQAEAKGIKPMDEATLDAMGSVWPEDEDIDEFVAWLRKCRRSGRYT